MNCSKLAGALAIMGLSVAAAPPAAVPKPAASPAAAATTATGDKIVCRTDKAVGSRVATKRVCMTAREWEAQRMLDRQKIEQGQTQRTYTGNN